VLPFKFPASDPRMPQILPSLRARSSGGGRTDSHDRTAQVNTASRLTTPYATAGDAAVGAGCAGGRAGRRQVRRRRPCRGPGSSNLDCPRSRLPFPSDPVRPDPLRPQHPSFPAPALRVAAAAAGRPLPRRGPRYRATPLATPGPAGLAWSRQPFSHPPRPILPARPVGALPFGGARIPRIARAGPAACRLVAVDRCANVQPSR
jgi:hypothetical protein